MTIDIILSIITIIWSCALGWFTAKLQTEKNRLKRENELLKLKVERIELLLQEIKLDLENTQLELTAKNKPNKKERLLQCQ